MEGEKRKATVLIDTWGVNPLEMRHGEGEEPQKEKESVTE